MIVLCIPCILTWLSSWQYVDGRAKGSKLKHVAVIPFLDFSAKCSMPFGSLQTFVGVDGMHLSFHRVVLQCNEISKKESEHPKWKRIFGATADAQGFAHVPDVAKDRTKMTTNELDLDDVQNKAMHPCSATSLCAREFEVFTLSQCQSSANVEESFHQLSLTLPPHQ